MNLSTFVSQLPKELVLAPIYRKGAEMRSGRIATGKNPVEAAHERNLDPADAALIIERSSKVGAVGLFTGLKGNGVVILDVDTNLSTLLRKWKDTLEGAPRITSTKKNAAKYVFRVPEELWGDVKGFGHSEEHNLGYEVLWGAQGLIAGEYPGGRKNAPEGEYTLEGSLEEIPDAPAWLIAEMKAAKAPDGKGFVKNRAALDVSDRTPEELATIVEECLEVIPHRGYGSRDHWVMIGMAIHSVLPGDEGLTLWSLWSSQDPEYAEEWENGNPCEQTWQSFKPGGGRTLGTLIFEADKVDRKRKRFSRTSDQIVKAAEAVQVQQIREVTLSFEEVIRRGMAIYEQDDVARMNFQLHALAREAGYRDQAPVEKLLLDHMTQMNRESGYTMDKRERRTREFMIPGLLPYGYLVLLYGDAGCGKSATALALMKHVVDGVPFQLKNQEVPVERGSAIYFNSDMSSMDFEEEYDLHEIKNGKDFHYIPNFNLYRQAQFVKIMNAVEPSIICIDSLSSSSGSKAGDENKAEFAQPLYWLSANNGELWPPCVILVLHHASKATGSARGSTAIAAAVSEVWNVTRPQKDSGLSIDQRVITIGKSRLNRSGESLLQTQNEDLTVSLVESKKPEEMQTRAGSVAERIMNRLQTRNEWVSRQDLNADPVVGGSVAAIKKTLQRLENRGVVEVKEKSSPQGSPIKFYRAVRSRAQGESVKGGQVPINPVHDSKQKGDTSGSGEGCPPTDLEAGAHPKEKVDTERTEAQCPPSEPSAGAGSEGVETLSPTPRARHSEIHKQMREAFKLWNEE